MTNDEANDIFSAKFQKEILQYCGEWRKFTFKYGLRRSIVIKFNIILNCLICTHLELLAGH